MDYVQWTNLLLSSPNYMVPGRGTLQVTELAMDRSVLARNQLNTFYSSNNSNPFNVLR